MGVKSLGAVAQSKRARRVKFGQEKVQQSRDVQIGLLADSLQSPSKSASGNSRRMADPGSRLVMGAFLIPVTVYPVMFLCLTFICLINLCCFRHQA